MTKRRCNLNIFVVGCGSIGERHIKNLTSMYPDFQIIATDTSAERLSLMEEKHNIQTTKNLEDGFKKNIDATIICTPPNSHIPLAITSIERGAHVFIEKPMSDSLNNVQRLLDKARSANLSVSVGYCFRFHPGLKAVKRVVDSGDVGRVEEAIADIGRRIGERKSGRGTR